MELKMFCRAKINLMLLPTRMTTTVYQMQSEKHFFRFFLIKHGKSEHKKKPATAKWEGNLKLATQTFNRT